MWWVFLIAYLHSSKIRHPRIIDLFSWLPFGKCMLPSLLIKLESSLLSKFCLYQLWPDVLHSVIVRRSRSSLVFPSACEESTAVNKWKTAGITGYLCLSLHVVKIDANILDVFNFLSTKKLTHTVVCLRFPVVKATHLIFL